MKEKICVNIYGGKGLLGGKETPLEADVVFCERASECSFHEEGKCLLCRSFMQPSRCPYGRVETVKGYTSRAKKYYDFKRQWESDPTYGKLRYPNGLVSVMGDTLYIYTNYVDVHTRNERDEKWRRDINGYVIGNCGFGCNYVFLPIKDVSNELLYAIFEYSPTGLMGGSIDAWKAKRVPEILQGLKKCVPEIYAKFVLEYPEYNYAPNYIGKKAFVDSLAPGTIFTVKGKKWLYDGEFVSSATEIDIGSSSPWWLQGGTETLVKIRVNPRMTIEVTDNSIVDDNTRFE